MAEQNEIDGKLLRYLFDEITTEERAEVDAWISGDENHARYFRDFQRLHLEMLWGTRVSMVDMDFRVLHRRLTRRRMLWLWTSVAASVVLLLCVGGWLLLSRNGGLEAPVQELAIQSGRPQAILHLSSGESVRVENVATVLSERDCISITVNETGNVSYEARGDVRDEKDVMNRIEVPRGGEFSLELEDGSRVWLNAGSELSYPARFKGKQRVVYLKGEAYFDVMRNEEKPFVVQVEDVQVKVLGTEFNVTAYGNGKVETVLVEGAVSMNHGEKKVLLKPNQKGMFEADDNLISVEDVDVLPYVAWKNGDFIFKDESLESIMDKLSRWYDLEVFYRNEELRNIHLSGNLKRYKDVRELFRSFEKISDARFSVNGKTVVISK